MAKRTVFIISDSTGITAGALSKLLEHFPRTEFTQVRLPFTDSEEKVDAAATTIAKTGLADSERPIVILSIGNPMLRHKIKSADAYFLDLFDNFIDLLGEELGEDPLTSTGVAHSVMGDSYHERMDAINFTLGHDDGMTNAGLDEAEVILVGVSRCGKTPITIKPERLHSVRSERRPDSFYASLDNCRNEILTAENMMRRYEIPWADSTSRSIEELSTMVLQSIMKHKSETPKLT